MVNGVPAEEKIDWDVRRVFPNRAGYPSGMQTEHFKSWLVAARAERKLNPSKW